MVLYWGRRHAWCHDRAYSALGSVRCLQKERQNRLQRSSLSPLPGSRLPLLHMFHGRPVRPAKQVNTFEKPIIALLVCWRSNSLSRRLSRRCSDKAEDELQPPGTPATRRHIPSRASVHCAWQHYVGCLSAVDQPGRNRYHKRVASTRIRAAWLLVLELARQSKFAPGGMRQCSLQHFHGRVVSKASQCVDWM